MTDLPYYDRWHTDEGPAVPDEPTPMQVYRALDFDAQVDLLEKWMGDLDPADVAEWIEAHGPARASFHQWMEDHPDAGADLLRRQRSRNGEDQAAGLRRMMR